MHIFIRTDNMCTAHLASSGGGSGQVAVGGVRCEADGLQHPLRRVQEGDVREGSAQSQRAQLRAQPHTRGRMIHRHNPRLVISLRIKGQSIISDPK